MVLHMFKKLGITTIICITLLAGTMPQGVFADEIDGAEPATKEVATEPAAEQKQEAPEAKSEPAESTQPAADTQTPTTETAAPTAGETAKPGQTSKENQTEVEEFQATVTLLAIDPDTNNQVKWLDKEEQGIKEGATAKDLLQNVLKETKGHAEISEAGIITSISGPAEKGFANQKLVADDNYKWIVTVNNR
ncbi:MAG: hypothetical protein HUJ79_06720, partial [Firmicutes bacterium]|nr:hypothetical protein [Bacillota bacterium]